MHNPKKAFTLVEMMIVIAIIAILVGIAVPGFIRARKEAEARRTNGGPKTVFVRTNGEAKKIEVNTIKKIGTNLYFLPTDYTSTESYYSNREDVEKTNAALIDFLKDDDFKIKNLTIINGGLYIVVE
jgi:prepilin-type N-terminal cleavage/methylation domain-containing protein